MMVSGAGGGTSMHRVVVVFPPFFDQDPRLLQAAKYLVVEKFTPHPPV